MRAKIFYFTLQDEQTKEEKLDWFERTRFEQIPFDHITPDQKANWINLTDNDFDSFLPLIDKEVKARKSQEAVFQLFSAGVKTQRDEWVYDFSKDALTERMKYFTDAYRERLDGNVLRELDIKWDRELDNHLSRGVVKNFNIGSIVSALYRPFVEMSFYFDKHFNGVTYQLRSLFPNSQSNNLVICCTDVGSQKPFMTIVSNKVPDIHIVGAACSAQCLPFYRYDTNGNRIDNITDWALEQFRWRYLPSPPQPSSPAGEEGAGSGSDLPSPVGAGSGSDLPSPVGAGSGSDLPSPVGEGQGVRANSPQNEIDLVHITGARRNIPIGLLLRAKELRQQQTPSEKILWECLRANRLYNAKFRRQHNIGQYIADFYCHAAKLVIELDGEIHLSQIERDRDRDEWMQTHGLTVLRFKNQDLAQNLEQVLQTIAAHLPSSLLPSPVEKGQGVRDITKLDIFHYTYAVLHHPAYRTQYELNLKREFPRLPFYADFHQWATWGKALMDLHLNYETVEPYGLRRVDVGHKKSASDTPLQATLIPIDAPDPAKPIKRTTPKAKLKADKTEGKIILDTETTLEGIPAIAWSYKLGNRSALEWILDQYKEKKPKDPTIAKLFNTYKFADYKEHVIDLLQRVCTVSVKTMEIIQQMPDAVEHKGG